MKRIFLISSLLISLNCFSQVDSALLMQSIVIDTLLYKPDTATYVIRDTRTGFKVVSDFRCVFELILQHFEEGIASYYVKYKGRFKTYTIYMNLDVKRKVEDYLKNYNDQ